MKINYQYHRVTELLNVIGESNKSKSITRIVLDTDQPMKERHITKKK